MNRKKLVFENRIPQKNHRFPMVPFTDENDIKIEAWKAREREKARQELVAKMSVKKFIFR